MEQEEFTPEYFEAIDFDVQNAEKLKRLMKDKDFKDIFLDLYLDTGVKFLTKNMTQGKADRDLLQEQIVARSHMYRFMDDVEARGREGVEYYKMIKEQQAMEGEE